MVEETRAQFSEGRNVIVLRADQPEVDQLNYGEIQSILVSNGRRFLREVATKHK